MYEGLRAIDYKLVGWSWGLWDFNWYRAREAQSLARRLAKRVSPGDIVVMHDGHHVDPRPDRRYAIDPSLVEKELDWKPRETWASGLKKTIDWYTYLCCNIRGNNRAVPLCNLLSILVFEL